MTADDEYSRWRAAEVARREASRLDLAAAFDDQVGTDAHTLAQVAVARLFTPADEYERTRTCRPDSYSPSATSTSTGSSRAR